MATNRIETLDPALIRPGNDEQPQITTCKVVLPESFTNALEWGVCRSCVTFSILIQQLARHHTFLKKNANFGRPQLSLYSSKLLFANFGVLFSNITFLFLLD